MEFIVIRPEGTVEPQLSDPVNEASRPAALTKVAASSSAPESVPADGFVWIDTLHTDGRAWVDSAQRLSGVSLFEDHLLDAENAAHPSYFDSTHSYEMIVFRGLAIAPPQHHAGTIRIKTQPTVFFLTPRMLVTVRAADSRLVPALRERLIQDAQTGQRLPTGPEELMLRMLNHMVDRYLELRQPFTDQIESWQKALLDPRRPFNDWLQLLDARSEARKLELLCEEQLDAIQEWRDERLDRFDPGATCPPSALPALNDRLQVRANDVVEHIHRVLAHAKRLEASVETAVQLHFSATAHRTNEIMRTLTTITAIFMPLTLITGVFGMNFEFIPGLQSKSGFWITMGVMLALALAMLLFFRARRYLAGNEMDRRLAKRKREREQA